MLALVRLVWLYEFARTELFSLYLNVQGRDQALKRTAEPLTCTAIFDIVNNSRKEVAMPLDRLDTAIAFVVILLGVSMIVTLLTQIVSALFAYRGRYLLEGLEQLFQTLDPALSDKAKGLAKNVLTHAVSSD